MNINQLIKITNDLERCALCPDKDYGCEHCDVDPDVQDELREYYQEIKKNLTENANLKVKIAQAERKIFHLRERLNDIGEEITDCDYDCDGDPSAGIQPCKFWIAPDVDESDMPIPGYCSVREEMGEDRHA